VSESRPPLYHRILLYTCNSSNVGEQSKREVWNSSATNTWQEVSLTLPRLRRGLVKRIETLLWWYNTVETLRHLAYKDFSKQQELFSFVSSFDRVKIRFFR